MFILEAAFLVFVGFIALLIYAGLESFFKSR